MATAITEAAETAKLHEQTLDMLVVTQDQLQRQDAELAALKAEDEAKRRIIAAELQQGDLFTKRARPAVVYAGLLFIFLNHVLVPPLFHLFGKPIPENGLLDLPTDFWLAWGGIVATWSIGRSFEKTGIANRVTNLITGSAPSQTKPAAPRASSDGAVG